MKPLFVLLAAFLLSFTVLYFTFHEWKICLAGNIAMSVMLLFTSIGHFAFSKGMMLMLPDCVPFKKAVVFVTGIIEMVAAATLLIPSTQRITSIFLLIFFLCILPANLNAAMKKIDHEKATTRGKGLKYLWFRVPFQLFLMLWVWYFGLG